MLYQMGVRGYLIGILRSYLNNRTQHIATDGGRSTSLRVHSGAPQRSLLGHFVSGVYKGGAQSSHTIQNLSFSLADDLKITTNQNDLSDCFPVLQSWAALNKMSFHPKSSEIFGSEACDVEVIESHRDLGLIVSSNLSWTDHVSLRLAKAYNTFHRTRRN